MPQPFLIFGHRGSPKRAAENTVASFDEALRSGADGFETDLRLLSDHTAILFHDDELEDREIESFSAADLAARGKVVQKAGDLSAYAGRTTMILEVKRGRWEDELVKLVAGWPKIVIASFDHSIVRELHRRGVSAPLGITTCGTIVDVGAYASRLGATWCFPEYRYADRGMVESLHDHGVRVVPWTPDRRREWELLREIGCDGVITDLPHEAVAWRGVLRLP